MVDSNFLEGLLRESAMLKLVNDSSVIKEFHYYKNTVKELFGYSSSFRTSYFLLNSKGGQIHGTQSTTILHD